MKLVIDGNELLMKSIFVWRKNKKLPIEFFFLKQLFKYINMFKSDEIYVVADSGGSWRKKIYPEYKANRKEFRDKHDDIDWEHIFKNYEFLLHNLQSFTPIKTVKIYSIEGDDIISYLCRYSKDKVTIVSQDKDMYQLLLLPNVQIYSPRKKDLVWEEQPHLIAEDKIKHGDKGDNIPSAKTTAEYIRNQILIDLINIPTSIDSVIREYIDSIKKDKLKYRKFLTLYSYKFLKGVYNNLLNPERKEK